MKKMTNGKDIKFVADALIPAYQKRGYYVEGEETTPPPCGDPEGQTAPEGQVNPDSQVEPEGQAAPDEPDTAVIAPAGDPEGQTTKPFVCPVCGKGYDKKAYLEKHMAEKHNQD